MKWGKILTLEPLTGFLQHFQPLPSLSVKGVVLTSTKTLKTEPLVEWTRMELLKLLEKVLLKFKLNLIVFLLKMAKLVDLSLH